MRVMRLSHAGNCLAHRFQAVVERRGFDDFDVVFQFRIHRLPELSLLVGNGLNRAASATQVIRGMASSETIHTLELQNRNLGIFGLLGSFSRYAGGLRPP